MIFRLVKQNNLKYREVAEVLDLSEKTVENQLVIAHKKISGSLPVHLLPDRKK
jgi:RNA polymerase sigma-70 factor (ECF subfamily)